MSKRSRKINEVLEDKSSTPKTPREELAALDAEYAAEERAAREAAKRAQQAETPKETGRVTKTGKLIRDVESTKKMEFNYPPEEPEEETPKKNGRKKDDYYIFRQVRNPKNDAKAWVLASEPMRNVSECDKFVKEAGEKFEGAVLMIAQVKKVAKVEAVVKKTIKF